MWHFTNNNIYIASAEEMKAQGDILTQKLLDFGISGVVRAIHILLSRFQNG